MQKQDEALVGHCVATPNEVWLRLLLEVEQAKRY